MSNLHERIENDFTLHPPTNPDVGHKMDYIRAAFKDLAHTVVDATPASREQSSALTKLEESLYHAIAAIARNQEQS